MDHADDAIAQTSASTELHDAEAFFGDTSSDDNDADDASLPHFEDIDLEMGPVLSPSAHPLADGGWKNRPK